MNFYLPPAGAVIGFVITSSTSLVIRAVGPTLRVFGESAATEDPVLTLYSTSSSTPLRQVDNWDHAEVAQVATASGALALPACSRDAAMLVHLIPGGYTVQVTHNVADNRGGQILLEMYRVR
jgi:hypothetical protein